MVPLGPHLVPIGPGTFEPGGDLGVHRLDETAVMLLDHPGGAVAQSECHQDGAHTLLERPRSSGVAQVAELEARDAREGCGGHPGAVEGLAA